MGQTAAEAQIRLELLKRALRLAPVAIIATIVNATILILLLWSNASHSVLVFWYAATWGVLLLRAGFLFRYRAGLIRIDQAPAVERLFVIGVFWAGSVWGSAGYFLFPVDSPSHQTLMVFVLCGMAAGASEAFSSIMAAFFAFTLPALLPLFVRLLEIGDPIYHAMSGMTLLYLVLTTFIALRINSTTRESVRLKEHGFLMARRATESNLKLREEIAGREKVEESLRASEAQLKVLSSRLISSQEEERRRIACELHDSIGQTLAALKYWIETLIHAKTVAEPEEAMKKLQMFVPILQNSIDETRAIYMGLRPTVLDSMGIVAALGWLRKEFCKLHPDQHVELAFDIEEEDIPEALKIVIFRIAQESLNNVAKHSGAEWVDLSLKRDGAFIKLTIRDDGAGANTGTLPSGAECGNGLGLRSMRERAEFAGGMFSIESVPGQGTTITAIWPLKSGGAP